MKTWHIIGAGIAGLSAAKSIREKHPAHRVILYEAAGHCGGRCRSFYDRKLGAAIDNATHVVLRANRNVSKLTGDLSFRRNIYRSQRRLALKSLFNTEPKAIPPGGLLNVFRKLFPFTDSKLGLYFSQNDLSRVLIEPLQTYADEIKFGFVLKGFRHADKRLIALAFGNGKQVDIGAADMVVSAMDASNYHKIFGAASVANTAGVANTVFDFSPIANIVYRIDAPVPFPNGLDYMAATHEGIDWLFRTKETLTAVFSNASLLPDAAETWRKIARICGLETALVPPFRVLYYPRATIRQDRQNNARRRVRPAYDNLRVIGDWTMTDWPCSLEAAVVSGKKAVSD